MCTKDLSLPEINTEPVAFQDHRRRDWPEFVQMGEGAPYLVYKKIYQAVKKTGLPNCLVARVPLPSNLNIQASEKYAVRDTDELQLVQIIKYGFPLGYLGPHSDTTTTLNHSSAVDHPTQVEEFIRGEVEKRD